MKAFCVELAAPPSVNHMYVNRGATRGKAKSKEYAQWERDGLWLLKTKTRGQAPIKHFGCHVWTNVDYKRDPDNMIKVCLDLLESGGAIMDDRYQEDVRISRIDHMPMSPMVTRGCILLSWWPVAVDDEKTR